MRLTGELVTGRTLVNGRYGIGERPSGQGGVGEVSFGRDVRLDRPVTVKFVRLPRASRSYVRRFVRESRTTAPSTRRTPVYDVGRTSSDRTW